MRGLIALSCFFLIGCLGNPDFGNVDPDGRVPPGELEFSLEFDARYPGVQAALDAATKQADFECPASLQLIQVSLDKNVPEEGIQETIPVGNKPIGGFICFARQKDAEDSRAWLRLLRKMCK